MVVTIELLKMSVYPLDRLNNQKITWERMV